MEKKVNKPVPSPENTDKPYRKTERRKNRIKFDDSVSKEYASKEAFDTGAEEMLQPMSDDEHEDTPLPPAKEPVSAKKRKMKRVIFYIVTVVIVLSVCSLLSLTAFFKIDDIIVEGETRYTHEDIIAASMIKKNDNLILCNTSPGEEKIVEKFPYVETVDIQKKLFNKVVIKIKEAKPTSIIENKGKYYVLSKNGKIIEIDEKKMYDVPIILGAKLKSEKLCDYAEYENENVAMYIKEIMAQVKQYEIKNIATIDITSLTNIILIRKNGFKLIIGAPENLDYKFKTAKAIMEQNVSDNDIGVLDVSTVDEEGARSYFKSKVEEPSKVESSEPKQESKTEVSKENTESSQPVEESSQEEETSSEEENSMQESEEEYTENSDDEESEYTEEEESPYDEEDDTDDSDLDEESEYTEEEEDSDEEEGEFTDDTEDTDESDYTEDEDNGGDDEYTDEDDTDESA